MRITDLDTPAILIDLDVMERNLSRVADYAAQHGFRLRPHTKTHKIPALGARQIALGAAGLTVAKTSEAEVMLAAGPPDLLVAYPVVGRRKVERLMQVATHTSVTVSLDSAESAAELSEAAVAAGRRIGVLVEMDVGLRRVGVDPHTGVVPLAKTVAGLPGLEFRGVAFYPGHIKNTGEDAAGELCGTGRLVGEALGSLRAAGLNPAIVSGGSTPTLFQSHLVHGMNEIRPGTYIFNDRNTWMSGACAIEDCAATILVTVVSSAVPGRMIIDGGSKTFSSDRCVAADGFGHLLDCPDAFFERMNEEHGFFDVTRASRKWRTGERLRVLPNHICVAMNLHEQVYAVRGEEVVDAWRVEGRGRLQ
jgi:D-serine deaminase-like pyridoxal phosphate-dependent protein